MMHENSLACGGVPCVTGDAVRTPGRGPGASIRPNQSIISTSKIHVLRSPTLITVQIAVAAGRGRAPARQRPSSASGGVVGRARAPARSLR